MILFAFILFIPFSIVSYNISKKNILNSIEFSNNVIFSQMNYNYTYNSSLMSNICLEVFLNNNAQLLLYSQVINIFDMSVFMRNLADTIIVTNDSIESIVLYNSKRAEWFSTKNTDPPPGQDLSAYLSQRNYIPRLKPLLRQITRTQGTVTTNLWVFSYFMYQFSDPVENRDSYVVINQNASWFVDNLALIQQAGVRDYSIYLINESGIVYRSQGGVSGNIEEQLVQHLFQINKSNDSGLIYEQKINNERYMVSLIKMGDGDDYLLITRNYADVFGDLINLQRDYILFALIFLLLIGLLLIPFSRRIYLPMSAFLSSVSAGNDMEFSPALENEFSYLQNLYRNASDLNTRLLEQRAAYEPHFIERKLFELVNDSGDASYTAFKTSVPDHWLSSKNDKLRIVIFRPEAISEKPHYEKTDTQLLFRAVKNIIYRFLDNESEAAFFDEGTETLAVILRLEKSGEDELAEFLENYMISVKHHLNVSLSISFSSLCDDVCLLKNFYREARDFSQYRFIFGPGLITGKKRCLFNLENREIRYPAELDVKLAEAIREKNYARIVNVLEDIKNILYGFQYIYVNICLMTLVNNVLITLHRLNNEDSAAEDHIFYKKITSMEFMNDFFDELKSFILTFLGSNEPEIRSRQEKNIGDITAFVQDNYSNPNLSSQMIGDHLGISNRYLMYKFLESSGMTLTEYIINVRMRKAASLLRNTSMPIIEIARQIGIVNDNYFYRLFKKVYHCTPREFTEKYKTARNQ